MRITQRLGGLTENIFVTFAIFLRFFTGGLGVLTLLLSFLEKVAIYIFLIFCFKFIKEQAI